MRSLRYYTVAIVLYHIEFCIPNYITFKMLLTFCYSTILIHTSFIPQYLSPFWCIQQCKQCLPFLVSSPLAFSEKQILLTDLLEFFQTNSAGRQRLLKVCITLQEYLLDLNRMFEMCDIAQFLWGSNCSPTDLRMSHLLKDSLVSSSCTEKGANPGLVFWSCSF